MPPVKKPKAAPAKESKKEEVTPVISGQLQKKIQRQKDRQQLKRGVVFIRHLPHGFFEDQLRGYFEQFGNVTRLRLARSKITGGTKGYAYVEFEYPEVAEVAAETMDNYLMFNKVVKASYIPPEKQFYNFFKSSVRQVKNKAGKAIYVSKKTAAIAKRVKKFNESSEESYQKRTAQKLKKIQKLNEKYAHLGIDFNKFVVGSKKLDKKDAGTDGNLDETPKSVKRKAKSVEKPTKKSKAVPELKDLLGDTLNEDSDDEDYEATSENEDENSGVESNEEEQNKSVDLKDLLGATLNDDSEDDDWLATDSNIENCQEENEEISETEDESDEDENTETEDDDDDDNEIRIPQKLQAQKKVSKGKKKKTDNFEELIKRKKHTGAIQKMSKLSKKPKMSKAKNAMQAALTKQLAQPLPQLKNKMKVSKKQKNKN